MKTVNVFRQLKKAELHYHMDGSMNVPTIIALAKRDGVQLPSTDVTELTKLVRVGKDCRSLEEYLKAYDITLSVLQTKDAIAQCVFESFEMAHADGVTYCEGRFAPVLHTRRGLSLDQVFDAVEVGRRMAEEKLKSFRAGVIVCGMRQNPPAESVEVAHAAVRHRKKNPRGVLGFDIAGPEYGFSASLFRDAYNVARAGGLGLTAHAGESDSWESVHRAIHDLGVQRVGHGTHAIENASTMDLLRTKHVVVEACITSNVLTKSIQRTSDHPARQMLRASIPLTLCTDGMTMTNTDLSTEYQVAHQVLGFNKDDLIGAIQNGFKGAFLPNDERLALAKDATDHAKNVLKNLDKN